MRSQLLIFTITVTTIFAACSKSTPTTTDGLLTWKPWSLQRADTIFIDTAGQPTGQKASWVPTCSDRPNFIYKHPADLQTYTGCEKPIVITNQSYLTWVLTNDKISVTFYYDGRGGGPIWNRTDSIVTLTKDSLVYVTPAQYFSNLNSVPRLNPYIIRNYFTH